MKELKEKFNAIYVTVFDSDGQVKACGRDRCKALMSVASEIEPGTEFGDKTNGYLNIDNIKALYDKLNKT